MPITNFQLSKVFHAIKPVDMTRAIRLTSAIALTLCISTLTACTTPQEEARKREHLMSDFVTGVTKHLLDRNPETVKESMNILTRNELTEATVEKLQSEHMIPETDISVLKLIDEAQKKHTSNEVVVAVARAISPADKDSVQYRVTGREILKTTGKPDDFRTFQYTITCYLTPEMGGYPRITDVVNDKAPAATEKSEEAKGGGSSAKRKKHH